MGFLADARVVWANTPWTDGLDGRTDVRTFGRSDVTPRMIPHAFGVVGATPSRRHCAFAHSRVVVVRSIESQRAMRRTVTTRTREINALVRRVGASATTSAETRTIASEVERRSKGAPTRDAIARVAESQSWSTSTWRSTTVAYWGSRTAKRGYGNEGDSRGMMTKASGGDASAAKARDEGARGEEEEEVGEDSAGKREAGRVGKKNVFVMPDDVPEEPRIYRAKLVRSDHDADLARAKTCEDAVAIAREYMANAWAHPPASRQMRIIAPKIKSKKDASMVFDLLAFAHEQRVAIHAPAASGDKFPTYGDAVFTDILDRLREIDDFESVSWMCDNINQLGGEMSRTVAKQSFFACYKAPFEITYKVYDSVRETFGSSYFASFAVVTSALNHSLLDLAKEYAVAFEQSGVPMSPKVLLRFMSIGVNTGDVETAQFGREHYLACIAKLNAYKVERLVARNERIKSGKQDGEIIEIPKYLYNKKPLSPYYFSAMTFMNLLKGDVSAATEALNELSFIAGSDFKELSEDTRDLDGTTATEDFAAIYKVAVVRYMEQWPKMLYGNGYVAKSREEMRDAFKAAIAGVTNDFVKELVASYDVDVAFAEKAKKAT